MQNASVRLVTMQLRTVWHAPVPSLYSFISQGVHVKTSSSLDDEDDEEDEDWERAKPGLHVSQL